MKTILILEFKEVKLFLYFILTEFAEQLPGVNTRSPYPSRRRKFIYLWVSFVKIIKFSTV